MQKYGKGTFKCVYVFTLYISDDFKILSFILVFLMGI